MAHSPLQSPMEGVANGKEYRTKDRAEKITLLVVGGVETPKVCVPSSTSTP